MAGQYYDAETGLHHNWFRYYDFNTGRYLRLDPIGFLSLDMNFYRYALNNPLIFVDPFGLHWTNSVANFSAGLGDALLLGFGDELRESVANMLDLRNIVDKCSTTYKAGGWTSFAFGVSRLGYAAIAKGGSVLASSGAAASAFRESMKRAFRVGLGRNWRKFRPPENISDAALRAKAGRTNIGINAYGAGVAAAGAFGANQCECK